MELVDFKVTKERPQDGGLAVVCYGKVLSENGNEYSVVKYSDGTYGCNCLGRLYHKDKECRHIEYFMEEAIRHVQTQPKVGFWSPNWCDCGNKNASVPVYFEDRACICGIAKHHYHCKFCGGVQQIG